MALIIYSFVLLSVLACFLDDRKFMHKFMFALLGLVWVFHFCIVLGEYSIKNEMKVIASPRYFTTEKREGVVITSPRMMIIDVERYTPHLEVTEYHHIKNLTNGQPVVLKVRSNERGNITDWKIVGLDTF